MAPIITVRPPGRYNACQRPPALLAAKFHRPAAPRHAVPRPALMRAERRPGRGRPLTLIAARQAMADDAGAGGPPNWTALSPGWPGRGGR